jgi:opacity protein-like surface antigen
MSNLKSALGLSAILLVSTAAQAQWEGNWLVGISGGYNWSSSSDFDLTLFHPAPGFQVTTVSEHIKDNGFIGGLLGGYQARCNDWLMGLELNVDWLDNHNDNDGFAFIDAVGAGRGWSATASVSQETIVGLTARLGYEVTCYFMPYLRAGVETSRQHLDFSATTVGLAANIAALGEGERRVTRFVGGIGAEFPIPVCKGLSLRAEYNYHSKGSALEVASLASDLGTLAVADIKPQMNTAKASIVWNFL